MPALHDEIQSALNGQINAELYSSYLYLSMSAYFESHDLPGFAKWMRVQSHEEGAHVDRLFDYVAERGGRVTLETIAKPPSDWETPLAAFEAALAHEQEISGRIDDMIGLALERRDRASESFLRWYVDEQVEEEASVDRVVKALRMSENHPAAMLMLDRELAARVFVPPVDAAK